MCLKLNLKSVKLGSSRVSVILSLFKLGSSNVPVNPNFFKIGSGRVAVTLSLFNLDSSSVKISSDFFKTGLSDVSVTLSGYSFLYPGHQSRLNGPHYIFMSVCKPS
mmetsp:Transcript_105145/g.327804  ORF Transcript_105145/g.327804 Transcript_105145/m.327804 type:complete len:106 (-) Transcript_105145:549-866(-)